MAPERVSPSLSTQFTQQVALPPLREVSLLGAGALMNSTRNFHISRRSQSGPLALDRFFRREGDLELFMLLSGFPAFRHLPIPEKEPVNASACTNRLRPAGNSSVFEAKEPQADSEHPLREASAFIYLVYRPISYVA